LQNHCELGRSVDLPAAIPQNVHRQKADPHHDRLLL
jgi:hypothetical protein